MQLEIGQSIRHCDGATGVVMAFGELFVIVDTDPPNKRYQSWGIAWLDDGHCDEKYAAVDVFPDTEADRPINPNPPRIGTFNRLGNARRKR